MAVQTQLVGQQYETGDRSARAGAIGGGGDVLVPADDGD
jgi:hypothetical protein